MNIDEKSPLFTVFLTKIAENGIVYSHMATHKTIRERIKEKKRAFDQLSQGKESLLVILDEAEVSESVYNSNAIENSTLTLKETEKILLEMELSRDVSLREVFEAKNLARVVEYVRKKSQGIPLTLETILLLHKMLIDNIDDGIAGRFRKRGEYVRVGTHVAPAPEHVETLLEEATATYTHTKNEQFIIDAIARFHLEFERIHPFNDGNGRIGRVLINYLLHQEGYPPLIVRNKEKQTYYKAFQVYDSGKHTKEMEKILSLNVLESLHKRLAYLQGLEIVPLSDYAKAQDTTPSAVFNAARRQSIPAFRERNMWKIGIEN